MKSLFASKVFWVAVAQSVVGAIAIFASAYPEVGGLLVAKSVVDVFLRIVTVEPIRM